MAEFKRKCPECEIWFKTSEEENRTYCSVTCEADESPLGWATNEGWKE